MPARPCPDIHPPMLPTLTTRVTRHVASRRAVLVWGTIFSVLGIVVYGRSIPGGFQTPVAWDLHVGCRTPWVALRCEVVLGVGGGVGFGWCGGWVWRARLASGGLGSASVQ